jgi:DNA-directed RNA polymerase subunit M/transcription elongation factor TFIIS
MIYTGLIERGCPNCGAVMVQTPRVDACDNCDYTDYYPDAETQRTEDTDDVQDQR